jgi:hypothetical protein
MPKKITDEFLISSGSKVLNVLIICGIISIISAKSTMHSA